VNELADVRFDRVDGMPVALLRGDIDLSNAALIGRSMADSISNREIEFVVDLTEVRYLDSAGIGMLFGVSRRLADHHQRLIVVLPSDSLVRRSVEVSGWPSDVPMVETIEEAVAERAGTGSTRD
jgi:anti-anti-sigma factor